MGSGATDFTDDERRALESATHAVGKRVAEHGYRGPFGIDAWRYRDADGETHFHPLGEINARLTFGLVAHALVERLKKPLGLNDGDTLVLHLREREIDPSGGELPLVLSPVDGRSVASVEVRR